jgi:S1-C subfamily serine protease
MLNNDKNFSNWMFCHNVIIKLRVPDSSESLGLSRSYKGVTVAYVTPGGPADKAGIQAQNPNSNGSSSSRGDIIKAIDGHAVRGMEDVTVYLDEYYTESDKTKNELRTNNCRLSIYDIYFYIMSSLYLLSFSIFTLF